MNSFVQTAAQLSIEPKLEWLDEIQQQGKKSWLSASLPNRKTEAWKYTSLRGLAEGDFLQKPLIETDIECRLKSKIAIDDFDSYQVVFINGVYSAELSSGVLPEGIELCCFSQATAEQRKIISEHLTTTVVESEHQFAALNSACLNEGVFIRVKKNQQVDMPVQIVHVASQQENAFSVQARCLLWVEESAEATLIERFISYGEKQNSFTNALTEIKLEKNANLFHTRLHVEEEHALHIGGLHISLANDARLNSFHFALGSALKRLDIVINHEGAGSESDVNGIYLARQQQQVDFHTTTEHKKTHGTSHEVFRGIVGDKAKAVFNGRIHIHKNAQKVLAELSNKNLLTSRQAEVDTKPELEIYADDVQCAHGATIAQLDEKALHYMQSRGIDKEKAKTLLSFGFINELIEQQKNSALQNYVRAYVQSFSDAKPLQVSGE